jgi:prevent-host-death family protein
MTTIMGEKEAREKFADLLGRVHDDNEAVIVEKEGKPVAVVISLPDYELLQQITRERFFQTVREIQEANKDVNPEEIYSDVTEVVEQVRQEMYEAVKASQDRR